MTLNKQFSGFVTRALLRQMALLLVGLIIIFSTAHSRNLFRSLCNLSISLLFIIFMYVIQPSAESLMVDQIFPQILFTYARNSSEPSTLSCGTPDVTLTWSDNRPPTLTLCVWPKRILLSMQLLSSPLPRQQLC
jgi:hypothetical protein